MSICNCEPGNRSSPGQTCKVSGNAHGPQTELEIHIKKTRQQLEEMLRWLYWLMLRRSHLSVHNKLPVHKVVHKPIWTFGIALWGSTSKSNANIIQRFQIKVLMISLGTLRYSPNWLIYDDPKLLLRCPKNPKFTCFWDIDSVPVYPRSLKSCSTL